jgi:hypothetical protein
MNKPKIEVNFNELINGGMILLSQFDFREDINGNKIYMKEGLEITIFEPDYEEGKRDDLIANGYITKCNNKLYKKVKWCCKINKKGIKHESDLIIK